MTSPRLWDIFCQVIDNYGDIGVCWRLCADLAQRGERVRLWTDDASALTWMAPNGKPGVQVLPWPAEAPPGGAGDVVIEAFGCEIPSAFLTAMAPGGEGGTPPALWINLEYLSAEPYVERCHRLPSPLLSGPAAGQTRWFFYPGFTPRTGGLLREADLLARQACFDRNTWRRERHLDRSPWLISLFCYEPPALGALMAQLAARDDAQLLVTPGRASAAVRALQDAGAPLPHAKALHFMPHCTQPQFDEMLWACDLNFVRGEDSLVRALWAGQPFIWHIYPQHDDAHHAKLEAFLDWLQAPESLRRFHAVWNGLEPAQDLPPLSPGTLTQWRACTESARHRLLAQDDLSTQLLGFVREKS